MIEQRPFILTLKLEPSAFARFNDLRQQHFPPERNFLPAHITLFHALPGDQQAALAETLQDRCAASPPIPLAFPQLRFLGRGVAANIDSPLLVRLRKQLATDWAPWLTTQDRQGYRPHITIQNKVAPEVARSLYNRLAPTWTPFTAQGEALLLWRYLGGPWDLVEEFAFGA